MLKTLTSRMSSLPTGKRFQDVDEIYIFHVRDGKLSGFVAVEDNLTRLRQLGFSLRPA
jgi:hypothetical protein